MSTSSEVTLGNFVRQCDLMLKQVREGSGSAAAGEDFSMELYWNRFDELIKVCSAESTKLTISFSGEPAPSPEECGDLIHRSTDVLLALLNQYLILPKTCGKTVRNAVSKVLCWLIQTMRALVLEIIKEHMSLPPGNRRSTGEIWELCEAAAKLPRDNYSACLQCLEQTSAMIEDAIEEKTKAIQAAESGDASEDCSGFGFDDDEDEEPEVWSELDIAVSKESNFLAEETLKSFNHILDELRTTSSYNYSGCDGASVERIDRRADKRYNIQLDLLVQLQQTLDSSVDDMMVASAAPVDVSECIMCSTQLCKEVKALIEKSGTFDWLKMSSWRQEAVRRVMEQTQRLHETLSTYNMSKLSVK